MKRFGLYIVLLSYVLIPNLSKAKKLGWESVLKDTVLTPWTPMTVVGGSNKWVIKCWGRQYIFDQNILPSQIISQGVPLLYGPMKIEVKEDDHVTQWQKSTIEVIKKNSSMVELRGNSISADGIEVNVNINIEYDGLMMISLSTKNPQQNRTFISIEIPYKEGAARYFMKWIQNKRGKYSGAIPNGSGVLMEDSFTPYYWIGDNNKGLFWFCESTRNWPNAEQRNAIQFSKNGDRLVEKFNIGSTSSFAFGIQATPVKPLPRNWRDWRLAPAPNATLRILWADPGKPTSVKFYGWPEAENVTVYKKTIQKFHDQGMKVLPYAAISRIPSLSNVYRRNKSMWQEGKVQMKLKKDNLIYIDPTSSAYQDTIANEFTYYMREYNLDGYYLDGCSLYGSWKNNNRNYYPILAYRELQRKLYARIKKTNPNAIIIAHMSADMDIPVLSYVDAYLDGEQFRYNDNGVLGYKVNSKNSHQSYLDIISLDQFRAEFIGKQWGLIPFFLPEFYANDRNTIQPTLGLATLLLLHDVQPWPTVSNTKVWTDMYNFLDAFGYKNSVFIPYYDPMPPASTKIKNVHISAYKKSNGQVLLIVGNLSKEKVNGFLTLNLSRLGIKSSKSVLSLTNNQAMNFDGNKLRISLDPLSYQLLWLK